MNGFFAVGSDVLSNQNGIDICELDPDTKCIRILAQAGGLSSPTWLEGNPGKNCIYSGGIMDGVGVVVSWQLPEERPLGHNHYPLPERPREQKVDTPWILSCGSILPVSGGASCHQALDPEGEFLAVSFYETGSLSLLRLSADGTPQEECCHIVHPGHSVHPRRQQKAHVHFCCFIHDYVYCCDLGEDRIYEYRLDRGKGALIETDKQIRTAPGSGPRHLAYSGKYDYLYVVTEMGGDVHVFSRENGRLLQTIPSIPEDVDKSKLPVIDYDAYGAAIHWYAPDRILVSNRGHDSISIFDVGSDGLLRRIYTGFIGGRIPRDFGVTDRYLICANQASNDLTVMEMNEDASAFHNTGIRLHIPAPTRIQPIFQ